MSEKSLGQLQHEKEQVESELSLIKDAFAHKEYSSEYLFEYKQVLNELDFVHPDVRAIVASCANASVHLSPDVAVQMIEKECFERMKSIIEINIKGKAIANLMGMKNDIERKMLKDQQESRLSKLKAINDQLDVFEKDNIDALAKSYVPPAKETIKKAKK